MASGRAFEPFFGLPQGLPRGPHGLSRGQVATSQRSRLMNAIAAAVADEGYAAATIGEISRRARVSPKAFYEHFEDKLDCYLTAYETFAGVLLTRLGAALQRVDGWHDFVGSALDTYLGSLQDDPVVARAFLVEIGAAGRAARIRRREAYEQFAALLRARHELLRSQDPELGPLPDRTYLALVHGVRELVADALDQEERPALRALAPDVSLWVDAMVLGAAGACASRPAAHAPREGARMRAPSV